MLFDATYSDLNTDADLNGQSYAIQLPTHAYDNSRVGITKFQQSATRPCALKKELRSRKSPGSRGRKPLSLRGTLQRLKPVDVLPRGLKRLATRRKDVNVR